MKKCYWLVFLATILLSGCGDIEWFPAPPPVVTQPTLTMAVSPATVAAGAASTLTFTVTNSSGNPAQTGLGFTAQVDPSLAITNVPLNQCGGQAVASVDKTQIIFNAGTLAAGTANCTITASVSSTTPSNYVIKAADISGLAGTLVNGAADQPLKVTPVSSVTDATGAVTVTLVDVTHTPVDPVTQLVTFTATVSSTNSSTGPVNFTIGFIALDASGTALPATAIFADANNINPGTIQFPVPLVDVSPADAATIASWAITSVEVF